MPEPTAEPNSDFLSNVVVQGGMVRVDTEGKSGPELERLKAIQEERTKDAENLVREFLEQVSFDPYYKAALSSWYEDPEAALAERYPDQPGLAARIRKVLEGDTTDIVIAIKTRIAQIDELLQMQLDRVLHNPDFQKLEASWRGLHYLVDKSETGTHLKIRLLNASKADLVKDIESAVEFDQSALFKQIYEAEYGTYGGNPFSVLIGDYDFGRDPQDVATLAGISGVAAAAHAPFIAAASPELFDWKSYTELSTPRDLAKIFETAEMIKWRSFRESEDSRYVTLTLPRVMMRYPYGPKTKPVDGLNYTERLDGRAESHDSYLWGNPAYALGARITDAFAKYRWCAAIRGAEGGGMVSDLPIYTFKTDNGDITFKCPTETSITDRREKELNDLGFLALCHCKGTDYATFFGGQTTNKPKKYNLSSANRNANISSMLPYILASSRFAHYLKVMMRDKIGSFMTKENVANFLNTWISQYVLLTDDAPQSVKARYPLREARVDVSEFADKVGAYKAIAFLKPHFQLDELTVSLRLVAELPPPAK
ncbi:type VI secretion system contractile sheath large subunit [Silvibacterium sp.]|uniref:type VI secretion system contractile sheath large subunit n=1 Tax=Silvibacterium sp. TaxID=1964179 RepID=UPI0039E3681C